jgi:carbonic anhydrase
VVESQDEELVKDYNDIDFAVVKWNGKSSYVDVYHADVANKITKKSLNNKSGPSEFIVTKFDFHHGSEHTIENKRYDLEM